MSYNAEESQFWQHNALFASKAKIDFFDIFLSGGFLKKTQSEIFFQKTTDFSLWGNCATTQSAFGWLHDYLKDKN